MTSSREPGRGFLCGHIFHAPHAEGRASDVRGLAVALRDGLKPALASVSEVSICRDAARTVLAAPEGSQLLASISPICRSKPSGSVTGSEQRMPAQTSAIRPRHRREPRRRPDGSSIHASAANVSATRPLRVGHLQRGSRRASAPSPAITIVTPRRCRSSALRIEVWPTGAARAIARQCRQASLRASAGPRRPVKLRQADQRFGEDAVGVGHGVVMRGLRPDDETVGILGGHGEKCRFRATM